MKTIEMTKVEMSAADGVKPEGFGLWYVMSYADWATSDMGFMGQGRTSKEAKVALREAIRDYS